jgi:lipid-A-disaccharide synthase
MTKKLHLAIVAGEASGDQHGAHLIQEIKALHPDVYFSGIGGEKMGTAGVERICDLSRLNVMGFTEIIPHLKVIYQIFKQMENHLRETKPDALILVDYPGFNLRLAKRAKAMGIKVIYYISPQLWAWKPGRMKIIQKNVDLMAVILPFEKQMYYEANVPAHFVGHPLSQTVKTSLSEKAVREKWHLPLDKKIIGILPGSRQGEIRRMFPVMIKAAEKLSQHNPDLVFVLPLAPTLTREDLQPYLNDTSLKIHFVNADHYDIIHTCYCIMITSGTATLEAALLHKPMIITYKASLMNYLIGRAFIRVKYIGLSNLLAQKMVVPEMLQDDLTPENLFQAIQRFLDDPEYYRAVEQELKKVKTLLTSGSSDQTLAKLVLEEVIS